MQPAHAAEIICFSSVSLLALFLQFYLTVFSLVFYFFQDDTGAGAGLGASSANVNRYIQQLAQEYSGDCKTSFDELSKIIQVRKKMQLTFLISVPLFSSCSHTIVPLPSLFTESACIS